MRKSLIAFIAALLGCVAVAPMAWAAPSTSDTKRGCADIVEGRATYQSVPDETTPTGSQVLAQMDLAKQACKNITYTLTVLTSETDSAVLATADGVRIPATTATPPRVEFTASLPYPGPDGDVCISITTSKSNGQVLDAAPDTGCVAIPIDSDVSGALKFR